MFRADAAFAKPDLYEALEDGQIDAQRLRQLFVDFAPLPAAGEIVFLGVDTSNLYRPQAETAEGRLDSLNPDTFKYEITAREII